MNSIMQTIVNKETNLNPIWIMRQAGRYLPEFREIRKVNTNFIELCLNENLSAEIPTFSNQIFSVSLSFSYTVIQSLSLGNFKTSVRYSHAYKIASSLK